MRINPLIFIPSPRDIPSVKRLWHKIPYDKFIVKYKTQIEAYLEVKQYFMTHHTEYTHIVLCPDDLEIQVDTIHRLLNGMAINPTYETISGICNIDESQPDVYDIQPLGCDYTRDKPLTTKGAFYEKSTLPKDIQYLEVGHGGSACRIITRNLFSKLSFTGATGDGWWDWQISKELHKLKIPNMVDTSILLYHRRFEQKPITQNGYSFLLKGVGMI